MISYGYWNGKIINNCYDSMTIIILVMLWTSIMDTIIVTSGKSVGKNEECVKPVVAQIELLYNSTHSTSPIKYLAIPPTNRDSNLILDQRHFLMSRLSTLDYTRISRRFLH